MDLVARRSLSLSSLQEATMQELHERVAELELAIASAGSKKDNDKEKPRSLLF